MESDQLQQRQTLLKLLERTAFVGVWTLDLARDRLEWSDQLAAMHDAPPGYTPPRAEAFDFYAPEWRDKIAALVQACATAGEPFDEEMQIVTLKGRRAWVRTVGHAVRDEAGEIVRVEGAVQEIAPHGHRAGTLLRHTVSMGGAMGSGEAFATVDREGRFTYVNEQAERLLGRPARELLGRPIWNSFQKTVRAAAGGAVPAQRCERRGAGGGGTRRAACPAGSRCAAIPFGAGLAVHLRDVTARHKSQEQLRLLESSIARLNDIVIITEAGPFSAPGPRIVFVNEAFERRTGYSREEVLGRTPRLLQGPAPSARELDRIRAAMEQWQPARVDLINYKKNGEAVLGRPGGVAGVGRGAQAHPLGGGRAATSPSARRAEEKIQYLAFYDPLTRLPNRQLLLDRLQRALSDQRPAARRRADVHRPGQLQGAQRHAGPPEGRPAAAAGGRAPALLRARAATPWRGWAATSS